MNRVTKSNVVPKTLVKQGYLETAELRKNVAGNKPLFFKPSVYAASDVRSQLKKDQYGKCAYCERYFNGDYGAVEHFRPKAAYQVENGKPLRKPGYYWLAYDWYNLLYSCSECNTSCKKNLFPLDDESQRDIAHENVSKEQPLLLNPATDDIDKFIEYHRFLIAVKDSAPSIAKAEKTIELFQLNDRRVLVERRKSIWNDYVRLCKILKIAKRLENQDVITNVSSLISKMKSEEAEFTGMFKYQRQ